MGNKQHCQECPGEGPDEITSLPSEKGVVIDDVLTTAGCCSDTLWEYPVWFVDK